MNWSKEDCKRIVKMICFIILFYMALKHFGVIWKGFGLIISVIFPFILGAAIAFMINVPMRVIEKHLFSRTRKQTLKKVRRPVALLITVVAVISVLTMVVVVVVPQITETVTELGKSLPGAIESNVDKLKDMVQDEPRLEKFLNSIEVDWNEVMESVVDFVQNGAGRWVNSGISLVGGIVSSLVSGVVTFFVAFVFAIYILLQKEKLSSQMKQILFAFFSKDATQKIINIGKMSEQIFSKFLSGQCLEAVILGTMFFVSMTIFRLPYALMVGVVIAVTALIPIVGAFIGCFIGALLILVESPVKAVFFVILFLILQQIEGNLIYPHVVGSSVGLPSIWVLVAVTVGGNLFGVVGMILFIPICSIAYTLFRNVVKTRLSNRRIKESEYR